MLVTCKFEDDSIKSDVAILRTAFSPRKNFHRSRSSYSEVSIVRSRPKSNTSKISRPSSFPASLTEPRSNMKSLSSWQHFPNYVYGSYRQGIKGQVTPKSIVQSDRNSNSSEILCLSRLSASLIKIQLKLRRLSHRQVHQTWRFSIWPEFELNRDLIAVLVSCKFEDNSIKSEGAILRTTFSPL